MRIVFVIVLATVNCCDPTRPLTTPEQNICEKLYPAVCQDTETKTSFVTRCTAELDRYRTDALDAITTCVNEPCFDPNNPASPSKVLCAATGIKNLAERTIDQEFKKACNVMTCQQNFQTFCNQNNVYRCNGSLFCTFYDTKPYQTTYALQAIDCLARTDCNQIINCLNEAEKN